MRYLAFAADYDGTLAHHGAVEEETIRALERLKNTGRRLIMVTGRMLGDLINVFPHLDLFERVVVENGGLLYRPATKEETVLGEAPPDEFVAELRRRGVHPLGVGHSIAATWKPHETTVLEVIRDLGLDWQVIFNKEAVMLLPSGVNKVTGLRAALSDLRLSLHNTVGIGDAENDIVFLHACECSAAVSNALPTVKERCDIVLRGDHGAGVEELIGQMAADDLKNSSPFRHRVRLGHTDSGEEVSLPAYAGSVLLAGPSGSGKSTLSTGFLERLTQQGYQVCVIDPEGDHEAFEKGVVLGDTQRGPTVSEVMSLLRDPDESTVVNMVGIPLEDRARFFDSLLPRLMELRARTGRPHWILVDEAHHLLPSSWDPAELTLSQSLDAMFFVTVHPDHVSTAALSAVETVLAVGLDADKTVRSFCNALGIPAPSMPPMDLEQGEAIIWRLGEPRPILFQVEPPHGERRRHLRKYAQGELPADRSFYFRGPGGKLNLRAQNLMLFLQIGQGVDEETWNYHLRRGDFSRWAREGIKDTELASGIDEIERETRGKPAEASREKIKELIDKRYTVPA